MLRRHRTPALFTIASIAFRMLESSSVVPAADGKTRSGLGCPTLSHAAPCCRRHKRNTDRSWSDISTFLAMPPFGVVNSPSTKFRSTLMNR
jgi:hypothetical protein